MDDWTRYSARLDGELPAEAEARMDDSLGERGQARLRQEAALDRAVFERLAGAPPCPESVWQETRRAVRAMESPEYQLMAFADGEMDYAPLEALPEDAVGAAASEARLNHAMAERLAGGPGCPDALWAKVRGAVAQRGRLETALDAAVHERLAEPAPCPELTWKRTEAALRKARGRSQSGGVFRRLERWAPAAIVAAACAILAFGFLLPSSEDDLPPFLELAVAGAPLPNFVSEVEANRGSVQELLNLTGVDALLKDKQPHESHHHIHFQGARRLEHEGRAYVRTSFICCRQPVELIFAPLDCKAGKKVMEMIEQGRLGRAQIINKFVVFPVGDAVHTHEVMSLVEVRSPRAPAPPPSP